MSHAENLLRALLLKPSFLIFDVLNRAMLLLCVIFFASGGLAQKSIELSKTSTDLFSLVPNLADTPDPIIDPSGFFSVIVSPQYFACKVSPKNLQCVGILATKANMTVQITDVPEEATVNLVALNQSESLESKTRFQQLSSFRTAIDGMPAIIQAFTYDNLNNVMLPVWVQFIDVLQPKKLAVLQITCASRDCSEYGPAIRQVQQSFRMMPLLKNGQPDRSKLPGQAGNSKGNFTDLVKELEK